MINFLLTLVEHTVEIAVTFAFFVGMSKVERSDDVHLNKETALYTGQLRMERTEGVTKWHRN